VTTVAERPTYVLRLRAAPGIDAIKTLRALLKTALRRDGLQCLEIREEPTPPAADETTEKTK
jgi:hypothetical protein